MRDSDDEDEDVSVGDHDPGDFEDFIAARTIAHVRELEAAASLRERGHDDLCKEALLMAGAVRRSFRTRPIGDLSAIDRDKE